MAFICFQAIREIIFKMYLTISCINPNADALKWRKNKKTQSRKRKGKIGSESDKRIVLLIFGFSFAVHS
jgi:hypothetical protein